MRSMAQKSRPDRQQKRNLDVERLSSPSSPKTTMTTLQASFAPYVGLSTFEQSSVYNHLKYQRAASQFSPWITYIRDHLRRHAWLVGCLLQWRILTLKTLLVVLPNIPAVYGTCA